MTESFTPAYKGLHKRGELDRRASELSSRLSSCDLCPRECRADRLSGELGECQTGANAEVSSYGPHYGEESPLVGSRGSGTIFFTHCNLCCQFCQNYDISQAGRGDEVLPRAIADMMIELQALGCHNINFVSPTHVVSQIVQALAIAVKAGLRLPLVYNTGGYDSVETLRLLDGIVDIYMPDTKYSDDSAGRKYSGIQNYWKVNREALKEMHRQVGDLAVDSHGVARRGLLVRHLVLPDGRAGSREVLHFLATEISQSTYINIMDQYRPSYNAGMYPELSRRPTAEEMEQVFHWASEEGLNRLDERPRRRRIVLPW